MRNFLEKFLLLLCLTGLALWLIPKIEQHAELIDQRMTVNDDARAQIPPLYRIEDENLFSNDLITQYYSDVTLPLGLQAIYRFLNPFLSVDTISRILPYLGLLLLIATLSTSAYKLAGKYAAFLTAITILATDVFLNRMIGGTPRSLGYPLLGLLIYGLVSRSQLTMIIATVFGLMCYPVVGVLGFVTTVVAMFFPERLGGLSHRFGLNQLNFKFLFLLVIVSGLIIAPSLMRQEQYGRKIGYKQSETFPELGKGGRYGRGENPPYRSTLSMAQAHTANLFFGLYHDRTSKGAATGFILSSIFLLTGVVSLLLGISGKVAGLARLGSFVPFILALVICHIAAIWSEPLLLWPARYPTYGFPVLFAAFYPAALMLLVSACARDKFLLLPLDLRQGLVAIVFIAIIYPLAPDLYPNNFGYNKNLKGAERIYAFLARQPKDSLVAGWPKSIINNVPMRSKLPVFLSYETHQVLQEDYILQMRIRMEVLIYAYFAIDDEPLRLLNRKFGVKYLIVDKRDLRNRPPKYFKPFGKIIERVYPRMREFGSRVMMLRGQAVVAQGPYFVLDLDRFYKP
ncbi:hypothetical protein JNK13_02055 [bacterium]|nr:hypothetical protein [bacterium]